MFTEAELDYLGGIGNYQQRMFGDGYLEFLRGLRLPGYHVESRGDQLVLEFAGPWPQITFSDFGTRRRFSGSWQHYVNGTRSKSELNRGSSRGQFLGTSNTFEAMANGIDPTGTSAHELPMILAGILDDGSEDPEWLRRAQRQVIDDWWEQYGTGLAIFLPDTWGTDFFFSMLTAERLAPLERLPLGLRRSVCVWRTRDPRVSGGRGRS